ncbi:MAG: hypothetical protein PHP64_06955 [Actinomycetota bacterium]|nr:hypothetical protein [Actinomycetota bacterium]
MVRIRKGAGKVVITVSLLIFVLTGVSSCGANTSKKTKTTTTTKLPPGVEQGAVSSSAPTSISSSKSSSSGKSESSEDKKKAATPKNSADLAGARFTVVEAKRVNSNSSVISSGEREVQGDYLDVELTVQNVGSELLDLTQFSFRLESPGIDADTYYEYYGSNAEFGKYVDEHKISAVLLDYSDLSPVDCKLKIGESLEQVFLFFDLNPKSVTQNEGVTKGNTNLIIKKVSGTDYGDEVAITLAGYPD